VPALDWQLTTDLSLRLMLRPTVSQPVCLGIKHPSGTYDQIFITVRRLRVSWSGTLSLTRGRVCRLQLLLVLASAIIISQIRDFPFRRLQKLAGLRWRYSTRPPSWIVKVKVMLWPTVPSASLSWNKAPIWDLRPDLYYCWTVTGLLIWGALSDERTGLSFARLSQQY
jgi:hypothetical protein